MEILTVFPFFIYNFVKINKIIRMEEKYKYIMSFMKIFRPLYNRFYKNGEEINNIKYKNIANHQYSKIFVSCIYAFSYKQLLNNTMCDIKIIEDVLTLINDIHVELDIFNDFEYDFKNYIGKEYKDYFTKLYNNNRDEFFDNLFNVIDVGVFWGETDNGTETYDMIQSAFAKKLNMMWRLTQN